MTTKATTRHQRAFPWVGAVALAVAGCNIILNNELGVLVPDDGDGTGATSGSGGTGANHSGGMGGGNDGPLVITAGALPPADFNIDYSASIDIEEAGSYTFELVDGAPNGLTLSEAGTLSGRPLQAGEFELEVRVSWGERSETVTLPLLVRRKPWMAFRVQMSAGEFSQHMVFLKHVYRSTAPTRVLQSVAMGASVGVFEFAPDGSRLAFLADAETLGSPGLYFIDTSGETLETAEKVSEDLDVRAFAWSPGGTDVAMVTWKDSVYSLMRLDLTKTPPEIVAVDEDLGSSVQYLTWVSNDDIVYFKEGHVHVYQRQSDTFASLGTLELGGTSGSFGQLAADTSARRLFVPRTYMSSSWELVVDFNDQNLSYVYLGARTDVTPDYTLAARCNNPPEVVEMAGSSPPLPVVASLTDGYCGAVFAKSRREVYWTDSSRLRMQRFKGLELDGDPVAVPGTYAPAPYSGNRALVQLTSDDEWAVFGGDKVVYASRVGGVEPAAAVAVSGEFDPAATGVQNLYMAPTSRALVYLADQDTAGNRELYYVDLEGAEPTLGRPLLRFSGSQRLPSSPLIDPMFSTNSAVLALPYEQSDIYCPEIHIVNLLDDEARSLNPLTNNSPHQNSGSCTGVGNVLSVASGMKTPYLFQP